MITNLELIIPLTLREQALGECLVVKCPDEVVLFELGLKIGQYLTLQEIYPDEWSVIRAGNNLEIQMDIDEIVDPETFLNFIKGQLDSELSMIVIGE